MLFSMDAAAAEYIMKGMAALACALAVFTGFSQGIGEGLVAAKAVEASGWCILVWVPLFNKLEVLQCEKHQNLTLWGCKPLLVLDMWEHSYFLQYKSNREEYIKVFWNIVNWNEVNKRYKKVLF